MYEKPDTTADIHTGHLLGASAMRFVLERERARAERSKTPFSLIVMTWSGKLPTDAALARLTKTLTARLRLTDEAGWLGKNRLALVLADTSEGGAWKVLRDVCQVLGEQSQPKCEVFVYPTLPSTLAIESEDETGNPPRGGQRLNRRAPDATRFYHRPIPRWKRAIDILLGSCMLALSAPILLIAAVLIKLTSNGPVIFAQQRAGLGGKPFTIYKLRTMVCDAESQKSELRSISEQDGPAFKLRNDPRVTAVGRILRKSCIDELPQLWNVLRGEMSIVGPRPLPVDEAEKCHDWEKRRLDVTPGLTCIWQVRGALKVSFADWMRMDIRYIRRRNLLTDIKLIGQTAIAVISHRASC